MWRKAVTHEESEVVPIGEQIKQSGSLQHGGEMPEEEKVKCGAEHKKLIRN